MEIKDKDIDILKLRTATGTVQEFIVILNHDDEPHEVIQQILQDHKDAEMFHNIKLLLKDEVNLTFLSKQFKYYEQIVERLDERIKEVEPNRSDYELGWLYDELKTIREEKK